MEYFIAIICGLILFETSFLLIRSIREKKPSRTGARKIFVDTSVLIDGRIINIARTGFLSGDLIILKSVLRELQLLADNKDSDKRASGRIGLDNASELERVVEVNTEIMDDGEGNKKVDDELLRFAKEQGGIVLTIDYNLIKVAEAEGINTLNVNDLALATRTEFRPGEKMKIKIVEKGSNRGQGVGHIKGGPMVVVDKAANKVGKEVVVEFVRFYETSAGRIIFAKLAR